VFVVVLQREGKDLCQNMLNENVYNFGIHVMHMSAAPCMSIHIYVTTPSK
jgi:hypothetical protein